jgi:hypothetical protein
MHMHEVRKVTSSLPLINCTPLHESICGIRGIDSRALNRSTRWSESLASRPGFFIPGKGPPELNNWLSKSCSRSRLRENERSIAPAWNRTPVS